MSFAPKPMAPSVRRRLRAEARKPAAQPALALAVDAATLRALVEEARKQSHQLARLLLEIGKLLDG
jgi:hypothetical protein